jgi:hypothetical protein
VADLATEPQALSGEAVPASPPRSRCGFFSLVLAGCAFAGGIVSLVFFVQTPKSAPDLLRGIATYGFLIIFLVAAPLAHITGFVLGLVALFRRNDSPVAGVFGIILNGLIVAGGALFIWAAAQNLGAFR